MNPEIEAYETFERWKALKTKLKVTDIVKGKGTETYVGQILSYDADACQVAVVLGVKKYKGFDISDAVFEVTPNRVSATRNDGDWIVFEEVE